MGGVGGHILFEYKWGDLKKMFWGDQNFLAYLKRILCPPCSIHNNINNIIYIIIL
jgi:hypothetical protein